VTESEEDHARTERMLIDAGRRAIEDDYAEALILGCAMEVGLYVELERKLGVPVIDPSITALKRAEYGAVLKRDCGWCLSRRWSCEAPPEVEIAAIGGLDQGEACGGRIVVPAG